MRLISKKELLSFMYVLSFVSGKRQFSGFFKLKNGLSLTKKKSFLVNKSILHFFVHFVRVLFTILVIFAILQFSYLFPNSSCSTKEWISNKKNFGNFMYHSWTVFLHNAFRFMKMYCRVEIGFYSCCIY